MRRSVSLFALALGACNSPAPAREAVSKTPDIRVVIRADKDARHAAVIHVVDLLKQAGVSKIAFGVGSAAAPAKPAP